jgi:muramoyltetrapeptide carboxypeptidase
MIEKCIPPKLIKGDMLRVIAPSHSASIIAPDVQRQAEETLKDIGLTVTYGEHIREANIFHSSSIASRVEDIHSAFRDDSVRGILSVIGGWNSNQLLGHLDWELIRAHPKVFCGYSDIDALNNAIAAKTGLVTYSGPVFSSFGQKHHFEYTKKYFQKALMDNAPFEIEESSHWSDDQWYIDQEKRNLIPNPGWRVIQEGKAEGRISGGNLSTLCLLPGTEYFPELQDSILFLEEANLANAQTFDRNLQSLVQQKDFRIQALILGRFQNGFMSDEQLFAILESKKELRSIPIVANVDFGHTDPRITIPLGGTARLEAYSNHMKLEILEH